MLHQQSCSARELQGSCIWVLGLTIRLTVKREWKTLAGRHESVVTFWALSRSNTPKASAHKDEAGRWYRGMLLPTRSAFCSRDPVPDKQEDSQLSLWISAFPPDRKRLLS